MYTELATDAVNPPQPAVAEVSGPPFDAAYWAHQPLEIRALRDIADATARLERASELAMKGFTIMSSTSEVTRPASNFHSGNVRGSRLT